MHRDIKPANIMVVRDGLVKITDFGIARMRTNEVKTMTGMILGSPKYMSPEQVAGKRADHRSDLFSLGVVLYEMLTGEAPFHADSIHGIMYQIMQFTPAAAEQQQPLAARHGGPDRQPRRSSKAVRRALPGRQGAGSRSARMPRHTDRARLRTGAQAPTAAAAAAGAGATRRSDTLSPVKPRQATRRRSRRPKA